MTSTTRDGAIIGYVCWRGSWNPDEKDYMFQNRIGYRSGRLMEQLGLGYRVGRPIEWVGL